MAGWLKAHVAEGVELWLAASGRGLGAVSFTDPGDSQPPRSEDMPVVSEAVRQLKAYFAGKLRTFNVPLDPAGTGFQRRVWDEVLKIPYGETASYSEIAAALGNPGSVRAVGAANGANPIPILIPCHRVIGASGKLVGYGGGLDMKMRLLDLEAAQAGRRLF